jgi:hypothetical protein
VTGIVATESDGTGVPRSRLCELAGIEPRKHRRWLDAKLIPEKTLYGRLDLIRALSLDELGRQIGPKSMRAVWGQISQDLAIPSRQLDIIVDLSQDEAWLAVTPAELAKQLPRNTKIVVVDVATRAKHVLARFDAYRGRHAGESDGANAAAGGTRHLSSRRSALGR